MSNRLNSKHYDKQSVSLPILNSALDTNSDEKKPRSKDDSDYDRVTTLMSHFNLSNPNRFSPSNRMSKPVILSELPPQKPEHVGKLCVVLDMDETLLHSRFTSAENNFRQSEVRKETNGDYDFTLVFHSQEGGYERVFVARRPCVEEFLKQLSSFAEVVVFTAALEEYAKPVLDEIDQGGWITHRLYRQSTRPFKNHKFVKDMSIMGRDLARIVLVDNNPMAMIASPDNAIPIQSWFDNPFDHELLKVHALCYEMKDMKDVRPFLEQKLQFRAGMEKLGLVDPRPVVIPTMSNTRNVNGKTTSASTAFSLSMNSVPSSLKDDAVYKPSKRKVRNQNSNTSRLRNI